MRYDYSAVPVCSTRSSQIAGLALFILCSLMPVPSLRAQAPPVDWARLIGTTTGDAIYDVAADSNAVYAVGFTFGSLPGNTRLGQFDAFLSKHDTAGNLQWIRQFGTAEHDEAYGVAVDGTGVYVVGYVSAALPGQTHAGFVDAFIRKYDFNGNVLWTNQFGSPTPASAADYAQKVAVGGSAVYVVGRANGALPGQTLGSTGVDDAFIRQYDQNGTVVWTRQFGTASLDQAFGVAADSAGAYVAGRTNGALATQVNLGGFDAFLSRFNGSGALLWHRQYGTGTLDESYDVAVVNSDVYAVGVTAGTFPGNTSSSPGVEDAFIRKFDTGGNALWTRQFGTNLRESGGIVAAASQLVFVGGTTSGSMPGAANGAAGGTDGFLRAFNSSGDVQWTQQFGTAANDQHTGVAVNASAVFAAGNVGGLTFLGQPPIGGADGYVLRFGLAAIAGSITLTPSSLNFTGIAGGVSSTQALRIVGDGGSASWSATVSEQNGSNWLGVAPPSGTATLNDPSRLNVSVRFTALEPNVYQGAVQVRGPNNSTVRIPVTAVASPPSARASANQMSLLFRTQQGATAARPQTLLIINNGTGTLNWSINAAAFSSAPWLSAAPLSGSAAAGSRGSSVAVSANPAGLAAGTYQALIPVTANNAPNNPLLIAVTLQVSAANAAGQGEVTPSGLVFVATQGASAPPAQTLTVNNAGGGTLTFQQSATTVSGGNWLAVSSPNISLGISAATAQVSVDPASLAPGIYRGAINTTFSAGAAQEVEVALVVVSSATLTATSAADAPPRANACGAASMDLVVSTIGNGMTTPVSFPRTLLGQVFDNCGDPIANASVVASVDGETISMPSAGAGSYTATWTPGRAASGIPLRVTALHPSYAAVERVYTVSATGGGQLLPVVTQGGVVEGAGFTANSPLAPGGIISVFGSQLAGGEFRATEVPLPRELGGVSVRVGGEDAPLYYVGPTQINAQMPYAVPPGDAVSVLVRSGAAISAPQNFTIAPAQPGVFIGGQFAAVLDGQSRAITADNPARVVDTLQIFTTGLGATDPPAATGAAAPSFSTVVSPVTVRIGDVQVPVVYQGLAPGFVGLYQVNVVLTPEVPRGGTASLVVTQNGIASNPNLPATIPIAP